MNRRDCEYARGSSAGRPAAYTNIPVAFCGPQRHGSADAPIVYANLKTVQSEEGVKSYHIAVFCAPASKFRWLYLYTNQKRDVFKDSHVQFFAMMGGVWREIVYDNMKYTKTRRILTPCIQTATICVCYLYPDSTVGKVRNKRYEGCNKKNSIFCCCCAH
ncbi:MAG: hypothetical protein BWY62_01457 [Firmicutes bacterium ADurb.Bin356]|nr:MAG: hypothetical protein BWY62_01457 [Firmicutes bacterium ADurb.Bin356]